MAIAALMTGVSPILERSATEAGGWLARTYASFPEQFIGRYFAVRGTHLKVPETPHRITLTLDVTAVLNLSATSNTLTVLRNPGEITSRFQAGRAR